MEAKLKNVHSTRSLDSPTRATVTPVTRTHHAPICRKYGFSVFENALPPAAAPDSLSSKYWASVGCEDNEVHQRTQSRQRKLSVAKASKRQKKASNNAPRAWSVTLPGRQL